MFKGYQFNQKCRAISKKSVYDPERELLHELLASDNENIQFEYDTTTEAVNAAGALKIYVKNNRQPLEIKQRGNNVYALKVGG